MTQAWRLTKPIRAEVRAATLAPLLRPAAFLACRGAA